MINTLLIERETHSVETLKNHLNAYCPHIKVCGVASSQQEACQLLQGMNPELIFLGMDMASGSEDSIFKQIAGKFETILLHSDNLLNSEPAYFQASAHLFKPIKAAALIKAVHHILYRLQWKNSHQEVQRLLQGLINQSPPNNLIGIPTLEGMEFLKVAEISRCEGMQRFTRVVLVDGASIISSYNIGEFCKILCPFGFFSPHKSHLINLQYIRKYNQEGTIIMQDKSTVPVARRRKSLFLQQVRHL
ncbi:MAG: LytTR family transcriptional regulator DNA-binding domain-containing protein [Phaeodactylibacter sp.]|nr:LytTR family transcriptional regulator DNA-binding domain-containing protein [Phaeodactylibacter sp.]